MIYVWETKDIYDGRPCLDYNDARCKIELEKTLNVGVEIWNVRNCQWNIDHLLSGTEALIAFLISHRYIPYTVER